MWGEFGLAHARFRFQSHADLEEDSLKKKLDANFKSKPLKRILSNSWLPSLATIFKCECCQGRSKGFITAEELR